MRVKKTARGLRQSVATGALNCRNATKVPIGLILLSLAGCRGVASGDCERAADPSTPDVAGGSALHAEHIESGPDEKGKPMSQAEESQKKMIHRLDTPAVIYADDGNVGILPTGTILEHRKAFAEGFVQYVVYVNVERPLDIGPAPEPGYIDPVTVPATDQLLHANNRKKALRGLLTEMDVTREELLVIAAEL